MRTSIVFLAGLFFFTGVHAVDFSAMPSTEGCSGLSEGAVKVDWHPDGRLAIRTVRYESPGVHFKSVFAARMGSYALAIYDTYVNGPIAACRQPVELTWTFKGVQKGNYSATVWSLGAIQFFAAVAAILVGALAISALRRARRKATAMAGASGAAAKP